MILSTKTFILPCSARTCLLRPFLRHARIVAAATLHHRLRRHRPPMLARSPPASDAGASWCVCAAPIAAWRARARWRRASAAASARTKLGSCEYTNYDAMSRGRVPCLHCEYTNCWPWWSSLYPGHAYALVSSICSSQFLFCFLLLLVGSFFNFFGGFVRKEIQFDGAWWRGEWFWSCHVLLCRNPISLDLQADRCTGSRGLKLFLFLQTAKGHFSRCVWFEKGIWAKPTFD